VSAPCDKGPEEQSLPSDETVTLNGDDDR